MSMHVKNTQLVTGRKALLVYYERTFRRRPGRAKGAGGEERKTPLGLQPPVSEPKAQAQRMLGLLLGARFRLPFTLRSGWGLVFGRRNPSRLWLLKCGPGAGTCGEW